MTPRSSWWQSTAERGGGLVAWLETLRALLAAPPARPVIFTANSGHELGHLGLDDFVAQPVACMHVGGSAEGYVSALQREVIADMAASGTAQPEQCQPTERFAFYERVSRAYAIVQTGDLQPWANFLFKKGVISEELRP